MDFEVLERKLKQISPPRQDFKPHKYLTLLSIIDIIGEQVQPQNKFYYNTEYKDKFAKYYNMYHGPRDRNRPLAPFFHLKGTTDFWHLKPHAGKEYQLSKVSTISAPHILEDTVDYAYLDENFFLNLCKPKFRNMVKQIITKCLEEGLEKQIVARSSNKQENCSLFEHEARAIDEIITELSKHNIGSALSNFLVYDEQTNDYYECDLIIITHTDIYVIELKHWSGHIKLAPYNWIKDSTKFRRDPHAANIFKAKLIKGIYQHHFRTYPDMWVDSVVILTNPEAEVEGASSSKTDKHCPTFDSIEKFIDYLKYRKQHRRNKLSDAQIKNVIFHLESLKQPSQQRAYRLPGYEILEQLTQQSDLIELIARHTDGRQRDLKRFRIFLPPYKEDSREIKRFKVRARNTIDAVSKIGDHQNILKVWLVPDESGAIIEGSDWSEQGTLRDFIDNQEEPIKLENALQIISGLLSAIAASHKENVIHRAVKPENILMVNGKPKLMNFDLSYQLENGEHITVIPDASILTRDAYTAPEVYRLVDVDERTDLFSVGVIFFELLTAELPFSISTNLEHMGGQLPDNSFQQLREKGIPPFLCEIIDKLIRFERKERIQTADEVLSLLEIKKDIDSKAIDERISINRKLSPDETYDVYKIEEFISEGRESQIYKASATDNEKVVLKVFNRDVPRSRIRNEEQATGAVHSSYLVHTNRRLGYWKSDRYFLELNFIDGHPMRKEIESGDLPSIEKFIAIASCLQEALHLMHHYREGTDEKPMLHNDIKPDNIMLTSDDKAVLIDLGITGQPGIDTYRGTDGYVAPDLVRGADLQFCESGDLFALGVTLFEWLYGIHPYKRLALGTTPVTVNAIRNDVPSTLENWLLRAVQTISEDRFQSTNEMRVAFQSVLQDVYETEKLVEAGAPYDGERDLSTIEVFQGETGIVSYDDGQQKTVIEVPIPVSAGNPFVDYLNSLQNISSDNENALAERQAINPYFGSIHVPSDVTHYIIQQLTVEDGSNVILTGHAGDGKSTIGLEVYKHFKNIPMDQPLSKTINQVEELNTSLGRLTLVKDLSELREGGKALLAEACEYSKRRFLIVSNSGAMLNGFEKIIDNRAQWREVQSTLLGGLESSEPYPFQYKNGKFTILNLVRIDNIGMACSIFERMVHSPHWQFCVNRECSINCPIYKNVMILQDNWSTVLRRVDLAYQRLYEYGARLTLRQITAHLSYAITAGLTYDKINRMSEKVLNPPLRQYLFYNRFFGDYGDFPDPEATQLKAVREFEVLDAGRRSHAKLDRMLWMKEDKEPSYIKGEPIQTVYKQLRNIGCGLSPGDNLDAHLGRMQIRRLLFFFGQFDTQQNEEKFISIFLNSPMLIQYSKWQKSLPQMSFVTRQMLKHRILHVLQEQFTGVRLPENVDKQDVIFITLNRRSFDIRQTAQIVLAKCPADNLEINLLPTNSEIGRQRHFLCLHEKKSDSVLPIDLPFLDYITCRHHGEIAQELQSFYVDRIERFKVSLLAHLKDQMPDAMMLVRLQLNHEFKSQIFSIHDNVLEVTF